MLHTIAKRLEICIDINIEISEVDHYTWVFISRIFRLTLEITLLSIFPYKWLTSYSHKVENLISGDGGGCPNKSGGIGQFFEKKISGGTLLGTRE